MNKKDIIKEIFVWTLILTFVFGTVIFSYSKIFVEPNIYNIQFKDIDGITVGSPVRFMGMNVGYVRKLKLKPQEKYINVQIIVTQKNMKIPNGTVARVEFYGLGGSKSIELMPPDGSKNVGILTDDTIRLTDITHQAASFVDILEQIEKYVKGINQAGLKKFLETVSDIKENNLIDAQNEIAKFNSSKTKTINNLKENQKELSDKINRANNSFLKINKLLNK